MIKKEIVGFLVLFLLIGVVSADCFITTVNECENQGNNIVFKMHDSNNAHVSLYDESNYNYALCCDFPTTDDAYRECHSGLNNTILKLSHENNAHVQDHEEETYPIKLCYENLVCQVSEDRCYGQNDYEMFSISSRTDAHVGSFEEYNLKVCCGHGGVSPIPEKQVYWGDNENYPITEIKGNPGDIIVKMILIGGPGNTDVSFDIKKDNLILDKKIKTITATTDSQGDAKIQWRISQEDIEEAGGYFQGEIYNFYFEVAGFKSNNLEVKLLDCPFSITYCGDYEDNKEYCTEDYCNVARNFADTCGNTRTEGSCIYTESCKCIWDDVEGTCAFRQLILTECLDGPGRIILDEKSGGIGHCKVKGEASEDCSEGHDFVEYIWEGEWKWGDNNKFTQENITANNWNQEAFIEISEEPGFFRYDPLNQHLDCKGGSRNIPCPASIQLPFFGVSSFIGALIIIAVIYYIISQKNEKRVKKRKKNK